MSRYSFTYNGTNSLDKEIYIISKVVHDMPARAVTMYSVPGRNGRIILDDGTFEDVSVTYECAVVGDIDSKLTAIREWLAPNMGGYYELSDSYRHNGYHMAAVVDSISITDQLNHIANFAITFNCKPQFYLYGGRIADTLILGNSRDIYSNYVTGGDPTAKITLEDGDEASVTINGIEMAFDGIDGYVEIDFARRLIHKDGVPCPSVMTTTDFPTINNHINITASSGTGSMRVVPNWWIV